MLVTETRTLERVGGGGSGAELSSWPCSSPLYEETEAQKVKFSAEFETWQRSQSLVHSSDFLWGFLAWGVRGRSQHLARGPGSHMSSTQRTSAYEMSTVPSGETDTWAFEMGRTCLKSLQSAPGT